MAERLVTLVPLSDVIIIMVEKGIGIMPSNFWHQHMIVVVFTSPHRMFCSQDSNLGLVSNTTLSLVVKYLLLHATHYY